MWETFVNTFIPSCNCNAAEYLATAHGGYNRDCLFWCRWLSYRKHHAAAFSCEVWMFKTTARCQSLHSCGFTPATTRRLVVHLHFLGISYIQVFSSLPKSRQAPVPLYIFCRVCPWTHFRTLSLLHGIWCTWFANARAFTRARTNHLNLSLKSTWNVKYYNCYVKHCFTGGVRLDSSESGFRVRTHIWNFKATMSWQPKENIFTMSVCLIWIIVNSFTMIHQAHRYLQYSTGH